MHNCRNHNAISPHCCLVSPEPFQARLCGYFGGEICWVFVSLVCFSEPMPAARKHSSLCNAVGFVIFQGLNTTIFTPVAFPSAFLYLCSDSIERSAAAGNKLYPAPHSHLTAGCHCMVVMSHISRTAFSIRNSVPGMLSRNTRTTRLFSLFLPLEGAGRSAASAGSKSSLVSSWIRHKCNRHCD